MNRKQILGLVVALSANVALANTIVVTPNDLAPSAAQFSAAVNTTLNGPGTNPLGFDWDSASPAAAAGAPAGFGSSSFGASVVNGSGGANPASRYTSLRIGLDGLNPLFGHTVTVGDLASISYFSNTAGALDWRPTIYTALNSSAGAYNASSNPTGNDGSFYHSRLQAFPVPDTNGLWNQFSTGGTGAYQLKFTDTKIFSQSGPFFTLSQITSGTVSGSGKSRNFSGDTINYIDFTLGADSGGGTEAGQLDGVNITLTDGESVTLNLEAVPLPNSATAGLVLIAGIGIASMAKRAQRATA